MRLALLLTSILLLSPTAFGNVRFATAEIIPYQYYDQNKNLTGHAIPLIHCVMQKLDMPYTIDVLPWLRAQKSVQSEQHDAFFVASQNEARNQYATISLPLFDGTRSWFIRKDFKHSPDSEKFRKEAFVGAVYGTNMHKWISDNFYNVITKDNEQALIELLQAKRVDAVLLTDLMYKSVSSEMGLKEDTFNKVVAKQHPLGVYFGYHFLKRNIGFMDKFNTHAKDCKNTSIN